MELAKSELVLWYVSLLLELAVCALALGRHLYRQLPVFTGYITAVLVRGILMYGIYRGLGYTSRPAFYSFWITQAVLLAWRGASIGELAWTAAHPYLGLRVVIKWLVAAIFLTLLILGSWFTIEAPSHLPAFVLALERDLELAAAIVLLVLLSLTVHYQAILSSVQKRIAAGLFLYSLAQAVNDAISNEWLGSYFPWWNIVRLTSFHLALVLWVTALIKPIVQQPLPGPVDLWTIREFMRQGAEVMHDLSARLRQFRKKLQ